MNWFILLSISLPIGAFVLLAVSFFKDRKWWRTSEHRSFFEH